jgi:hypothetical protein
MSTREGSASSIVEMELRSRQTRRVTQSNAIDTGPCYSAAGRLRYVSIAELDSAPFAGDRSSSLFSSANHLDVLGRCYLSNHTSSYR